MLWLLQCWIMASAFAMTADAEPIRVFAAASLKDGLDAVVLAWGKANPASPVVPVYAASPALAKQIAEGAPADVFFSADLAWMDDLAEKKLLRNETLANILGNRLVLVSEAANPVTFDFTKPVDLAGALGEGNLALANVQAVPAGRYAKASLEYLGIWDSVKNRVIQTENVRAALAFVARGEVPFGIVYASDAHVETKVRIAAEIPQESHPAIVYPAAVTAVSIHPDAAAFVDYLKSKEAQSVFLRFGFMALQD
jgi:molybdate transport system substrate-binding protein